MGHPLECKKVSAELLTPLERLAVSYAPASARPAWAALLAFDARLADAAREGRDPMMIQLRLAWWRDRMDAPAQSWPAGEPLLAALRVWDGETAALRALVDGWEARNVGQDGGAELGRARIDAMVALARLLGVTDAAPLDAVRNAAAQWLDPSAAGSAPRAPALPRVMRPLAVLRGMAVRERREGGSALRDFLAAVRLGWLGR